MKKFNLKAIIIILFIVISASVCFTVAHPHRNSQLNAESEAMLISFIEKRGIKLAEGAIIPASAEIYEASASNMLTDRSLFAEKLFGGTAALNAEGTEYTFGSDKLTFSGSSFTYSPKSLPYKEELSGINLDNAGKKAKKIAEECGFDLSGSIITSSEENGTYTSVISKSLNGLPVFNDKISMSMSAEGLLSINGVWYTVSAGEKKETKTISDALIQFAKNPERPGGSIEITAAEPGYVMLSTDSDETALKSVWRITLSDGKVFYTN